MKNNLSPHQPLLIKEHIIQAVRRFFLQQNFNEIMTPVLHKTLPLEPNLDSFKSEWRYLNQQQTMYLATSPEASLKKMLAKGFEKVFTIAPAFRNSEPADSDHRPEFLMLEWYRSNADYEQIMIDVQQLVNFVQQSVASFLKKPSTSAINYQDYEIDLSPPWSKVSLAALFEQEMGQSLATCLNMSAMRKLAQQHHFSVENAAWEELFNQIFVAYLAPKLGLQPVLVTDYPSRISPLCLPKKEQSEIAERFELYIAGLEIGNGNTEQTDAGLVEKYFKQEQRYRQQNQLTTHPIDQKFIAALNKLDQTEQLYAGMGLGIDRLVMLLADVKKIGMINDFAESWLD